MDDSIVPRAHVRRMGEKARARGASRDSHGMKPDAAALPDWLEGFDLAGAGQASPLSHTAPAPRRHFDLRQGEAA